MTDAALVCGFCNKSVKQVNKLVAGDSAYICDTCVSACVEALQAPGGKDAPAPAAIAATAQPVPGQDRKMPTPREIKAHLDDYVIGQDFAKEVLSVGVYNHFKRLENPVVDGVEIEKSNILLCGPTGVGKTLLAQTIARLIDVPFVSVDATALTEAGYVGEDVEGVIGRVLAAAKNDVSKAERGIVFLDEIDKKRSGESGSGRRDVSGEGVQQALLKLLEDSEVLVPPGGTKKMPSTELIKVRTKNILFIVGGAFVGLDKLVERSLHKEDSKVGFSAKGVIKRQYTAIDLLSRVEPEHLTQFGLIPELIGRLPIIAALSDLDEQQLVRVLTEPKNSLIKQTTAMYRLDGIELRFEPEALTAIAAIAKKRKTNGRALRSVLETRLISTSFQLPDLRDKGVTTIVVNAAAITDRTAPILIYGDGQPKDGEGDDPPVVVVA